MGKYLAIIAAQDDAIRRTALQLVGVEQVGHCPGLDDHVTLVRRTSVATILIDDDSTEYQWTMATPRGMAREVVDKMDQVRWEINEDRSLIQMGDIMRGSHKGSPNMGVETDGTVKMMNITE